jgi:hypothetical protein
MIFRNVGVISAASCMSLSLSCVTLRHSQYPHYSRKASNGRIKGELERIWIEKFMSRRVEGEHEKFRSGQMVPREIFESSIWQL